MKHLLLLIAIIVSTVSVEANAESKILQCSEKTIGIVQCISGIECECIHKRAGSMTNELGGFRWDCGINRPHCLEYKQIESRTGYDGPEAVGLDKSTETNIESTIGNDSPARFVINPRTTIRSGASDDGVSTIGVQN